MRKTQQKPSEPELHFAGLEPPTIEARPPVFTVLVKLKLRRDPPEQRPRGWQTRFEGLARAETVAFAEKRDVSVARAKAVALRQLADEVERGEIDRRCCFFEMAFELAELG